MDSEREANMEAEFMNGLCHVLARAVVSRMPWMSVAMSWGREPDGDVVPDHVFALDPVSGRACDARGWFGSAVELLSEGGMPLDGREQPMQWVSGETARSMVSAALEGGRLRHPSIEEATRAAEAASLLSRMRPP